MQLNACTPVQKRKPELVLLSKLIAPQAQLLETAKSVGPEALFKQVVKFGQIDPLWSILGDS